MPVAPAREGASSAGTARPGPGSGRGEAPADPGAEGAPGSAAPQPVWLTVLYDAGCPLCRWVRAWLERQDLLVPLVFVPLRSPQAWAAFPFLDHERTASEVTVVSEAGEVWTADAAWTMCLWATARFRGLSLRLAEPAWRPRARAVALSVASLTTRTPPPDRCPPDAPCRVGAAAACRPAALPTVGAPR
jgi:predicted DCC family thiol-disulfide oxidoreductase YuxK